MAALKGSAQKNLIRRLSVLAPSVDDRGGPAAAGSSPVGVIVLGRAQRLRGIDTPLAAGDVIHAVNGAAAATFAQLSEAMDDLEPNSPVALQVDRGIRLMFVSFVFESLKDKGIVFR